MKASEPVQQLLLPYNEHVQKLVEALRKLIFSVLPDIKEEADFPAKLLGYSYGPGYKHVICTIILSKNGAKLGIFNGSQLPDPARLLQGTGKVHKHVVIEEPDHIKNPAVKTLLKEALKAYKKRIA
jgi:hypothetical protein